MSLDTPTYDVACYRKEAIERVWFIPQPKCKILVKLVQSF